MMPLLDDVFVEYLSYLLLLLLCLYLRLYVCFINWIVARPDDLFSMEIISIF
jgi:hypothetical protein